MRTLLSWRATGGAEWCEFPPQTICRVTDTTRALGAWQRIQACHIRCCCLVPGDGGCLETLLHNSGKVRLCGVTIHGTNGTYGKNGGSSRGATHVVVVTASEF